jgi:chemotaxis protein MotB
MEFGALGSDRGQLHGRRIARRDHEATPSEQPRCARERRAVVAGRVCGDDPRLASGDRFVFQGEVLFAPGSAELSEAGLRQLRAIAGVLAEVTPLIPADVAWVLRVDGHADRNPIRSARFASNWELAAARAIAVAQILIAEGLPANRVAATSFGDAQPIDSGDSPQAFARNRRIELRLTDR